MFVVEPGPGRSKAYGSTHELGLAIRRGELDEQAKIYHRSSDRWLPITVHPEYRRAVAEHEQRSTLALRMRHWTFLQAEAREPDAAEGAADPAPASPAPDPRPQSWLGSTFRRLRRGV